MAGIDMLRELAQKAGVEPNEYKAIYAQIEADIQAHFEKHLAAAKAEYPEKAAEIAVMENVVERAKGEPLAMALDRSLDPQPPRPAVRPKPSG